MNPTLQIMTLISMLAGTAGKMVGGEAGQDVTIGNDLLVVAKNAIQLHSTLNGQPIDEVIAQLQDLPPIT